MKQRLQFLNFIWLRVITYLSEEDLLRLERGSTLERVNFLEQLGFCSEPCGTEEIEIVRKEGLSIPVRALVLIISNLVLIPTLGFP